MSLAIHAALATTPIDTIRGLDFKFGELYNAQKFDAVQALYNPGADLIPDSADSFVSALLPMDPIQPFGCPWPMDQRVHVLRRG